MLQLEQTKTFKKCLKKYRHKKIVLQELKNIVELLIKEKPIPIKYRDHELKGKYQGIRELHLKPDDLLLYIKVENERIILMALGSHSEIF
jgi:mRNA interferase YafQ